MVNFFVSEINTRALPRALFILGELRMEALEYIRQQAGLHFDPVALKTFLERSASKSNGT